MNATLAKKILSLIFITKEEESALCVTVLKQKANHHPEWRQRFSDASRDFPISYTWRPVSLA